MSCSPFDLRDYLLEELPAHDRRQVEKHVAACSSCREELQRLDLTQAALRTLPDEELPRGIAFVSDKVFEPSPWRRAWQAFWGSSARLGFASAAMLSAALVVTALNRPVPAPAVSTPVPQIDTARLQAEFDRRVQDAVQKVVAESEARQTQKTAALVDAVRKQDEFERSAMRVQVAQTLEALQKQYYGSIILANNAERATQGAAK